MLTTLALLTMFSFRDVQAIKNARMSVQDKQQIQSMMADRPIVLGRLNYAIYVAPIVSVSNITNSILSVTIPSNSLLPGDQFVIEAAGFATNASATPKPLGVGVNFWQSATVTQKLQSNGTIPALTATPVAWMSRIVVSVGLPNTGAQIANPISTSAAPNGRPPRQAFAGQSIYMACVGQTLVSSPLSSGFLAGTGLVVANSGLQAFKTPLIMSTAVPLQIDVTLDGADVAGGLTVTLNGGSLVGM